MNFSIVRSDLFNGKISTKQFEGLDNIIKGFKAKDLSDKRWLAYMLATVYHETAKTMQPIEEYGRGVGRDYVRQQRDSLKADKMALYNLQQKNK